MLRVVGLVVVFGVHASCFGMSCVFVRESRCSFVGAHVVGMGGSFFVGFYGVVVGG